MQDSVLQKHWKASSIKFDNMSGVGQLFLEWVVLDINKWILLSMSANLNFLIRFLLHEVRSLRLKALSRDTVFAYFPANVTVYTSTMSAYSSSYSSKQLCQNSTDSGKFLVEGCWRHLVSRYLFACCSAQMRTNMVYKWKWMQWKYNTVNNLSFVFKWHVNTDGVHVHHCRIHKFG